MGWARKNTSLPARGGGDPGKSKAGPGGPVAHSQLASTITEEQIDPSLPLRKMISYDGKLAISFIDSPPNAVNSMSRPSLTHTWVQLTHSPLVEIRATVPMH